MAITCWIWYTALEVNGVGHPQHLSSRIISKSTKCEMIMRKWQLICPRCNLGLKSHPRCRQNSKVPPGPLMVSCEEMPLKAKMLITPVGGTFKITTGRKFDVTKMIILLNYSKGVATPTACGWIVIVSPRHRPSVRYIYKYKQPKCLIVPMAM